MTAMTEKPLLDEDTIADLTEKIVSALKTVYDPEIPVDIYELGLIYKVDIDVSTEFIEEESNYDNDRYFFAYTIKITNSGKVNVQLISRHWIVLDANNKQQEIKGLGVVGEQPVIAPNSNFQYSSGTIIETPVGTMHGTYQMVADNGYKFDATIPMFSLSVPKVIN